MQNFWIFFLQKRAFTFLIMTALVLIGLYSTFLIPKESSPEVIIPVGVVSTFLRGGSAEDVEKLVTNKLEQEIANIENIDKVTSNSSENLSVISVQFLASADVDKSIADLKDVVDIAKASLPTDAEEPFVTKVNFADQPSTGTPTIARRPRARGSWAPASLSASHEPGRRRSSRPRCRQRAEWRYA